MIEQCKVCPECHGLLHISFFEGSCGIEFDLCYVCGTKLLAITQGGEAWLEYLKLHKN